MSTRRSLRLRGETPPQCGGDFQFRGLLDVMPPISAPARRAARSPAPRRPPNGDGNAVDNPGGPYDCGPKPFDIPGFVWSCEPNNNGVWQWTRVRLPTGVDKSPTATAITDLAKAYDFGSKQGRERWKITFVAILAADVRFNNGRMLVTVLNMLPIPLPQWAIQMIVGVFVRLVNLFQG